MAKPNHNAMDFNGMELRCDEVTAATAMTVGGNSISAAEFAVVDGVTPGTATPSKAVVLGAAKEIATITTATITTVNSGTVNATTAAVLNKPIATHTTKAAINATAVATAAEVATGYITSTSAAATAITLPTGTLLGAALGATQGYVHDLYIDNTAGASTVTIVVAVDGILSALAAAEAGGSGLLTVPAGVTGQARFTLMFSSATAYTFTRTA